MLKFVTDFFNTLLIGIASLGKAIVSKPRSFLTFLFTFSLFFCMSFAVAQNPMRPAYAFMAPHVEKNKRAHIAAQNDPTVGALEGNFAVNERGQASYSIPIDVPPGTAGISPKLSITYSNGMSYGLLGMGFGITGLTAITRTAQNKGQNGKIHGIDYTNEDRFALNGDQLVSVQGEYGGDGTEYRTYENKFAKITSVGTQGGGPTSFTVHAKDGQIAHYGQTADSRVLVQGQSTVAEWELNKIEDRAGNYLTVQYDSDTDNGMNYPKEIDYTGNTQAKTTPYAKVLFNCDERSDTRTIWRAGSKATVNKRLKSIEVYDGKTLVYAYTFGYEESPSTYQSRLVSIQKCGAGGVCLKPTTFKWSDKTPGWTKTDKNLPYILNDYRDYILTMRGQLVDMNGNGKPDEVLSHFVYTAACNRGSNGEPPGTDTEKVWINQNLDWLEDSDLVLPANQFDGIMFYGTQLMHHEPGIITDLNGNGFPDYARLRTRWFDVPNDDRVWMNTGKNWQLADYRLPVMENMITLVPEIEVNMSFVDLHGTGLSDFIYSYDGASEHNINKTWCNTGNGWEENVNYQLPGVLTQVMGSRTDPRFQRRGVFLNATGGGLPDYVYTYYNSETDHAEDVYKNTGSGWQKMDWQFPQPSANGKYYKNQDGTLASRVVDLNGDGLSDYVSSFVTASGETENVTYMNTGRGWYQDTNYTLPEPMFYVCSDDSVLQRGYFVDVNGSGLLDYVYLYANSKDDHVEDVYLNTGHGWKKADYTVPFNPDDYLYPDRLGHIHMEYGCRFVDINGNGLTDYVYSYIGPKNTTPDQAIYLSNGDRPDNLLSITNGLGESTHITYKPITDASVYDKEHDAQYPYFDIQKPLYVVAQTSSNTNSGDPTMAKNHNGQHITTYHYAGAKANHMGWGFLGFHAVSKTDESTGISEVTTYSQDVDAHTIGKILSQTTQLQDGTVLNTLANTWTVKQYGDGMVNHTYYFPYTSKSEQKHYTLKGRLLNTHTITTTMDDYGNSTDVIDSIADGSGTYGSHTVNTYANDPAHWIIGELTNATVTHSAPGVSDIQKISEFHYDDSGFLSKTVTQPGEKKYSITTDYVRNAFGEVTKTTVFGDGVESRSDSVEYDPSGRFATKNTNALGQSTSQVVDSRFGEPTSTTDLNGLTTIYSYDPFGRVLTSTEPDGVVTSNSYAWVNESVNGVIGYGADDIPLDTAKYSITTQVVGSKGDVVTPDKVIYHDMLNRLVAQKTQGFGGKWIWNSKVYDDLGRPIKTTLPYFEGQTPLYSQLKYDVLGRVTEIMHPDGKISTIDYDGYSTTKTNAKNQNITTIINARGKTVETIDNAGNKSTFAYDAMDNLVRTIDSAENSTILTYDKMGRKTKMDDPDKGVWTYAYNVFGELSSQTDAMQHTTTIQYDKLGRMTSRTDLAGTSTWMYGSDISQHNVGKLVEVNGVSGQHGGNPSGEELIQAEREGVSNYVRSIKYDSFARPNVVTTTINGQPFVTTTTYDENSRVETVTYPGDAGILNHYDDLGFLYKITNRKQSQTYWVLNNTDAAGHITSETHHNGLMTNYTYDPRTGAVTDIVTRPDSFLQTATQTITQNASKNLPNSIATLKAHEKNTSEVSISQASTTVDSVQNLHYEYDAIGNLEKRQNLVTNTTEDFSYDELNRLTKVKNAAGFSTTYAYDAIGNMVYNSKLGTYHYDTTQAGPHAVTSITGVKASSFQYDQNGNQIKHSIGQHHKNITYTSFDKPLTITTGDRTKNVKFYYDAERNRFSREETKDNIITTTFYLGAYQLVTHDNATTGAISTEQKYMVAPDILYVVTTDSSKNTTSKANYTLLKDNLGSTTAIYDGNANLFIRYQYTPFGEQSVTSYPAPRAYPLTHQGFTGHEEIEDMGLVHMNGRLYDPTLGRFLSADAYVQAPDNSQSLNRYSYCMNNPLAAIDPSGYWSWNPIHFMDNLMSAFGSFMEHTIGTQNVIRGIGVLVTIMAAYNCPPAAPALAKFFFVASVAAGWAGTTIAANGGNIGDVLKGVAITYATAAAWYGVGSFLDNVGLQATQPHWFGRAMIHGIAGGGIAVAEGGDFKDAFLAASASEALDCSLPLQYAGKDAALIAERTAISAVVGGTAAAIDGGNFTSGARTAAYAQLFNDGMHEIPDWCQTTYAARSQTGMTQAQYALCEDGLHKGEAVAFALGGAEGEVISGGAGTEIVQRAMSRAELEATEKTGLIRGGRAGDHYVSNSVNSDALRARQRLALPGTPEGRATLRVPVGAFSVPSEVAPAYNMPGGGMERVGVGNIPVEVIDFKSYQ